MGKLRKKRNLDESLIIEVKPSKRKRVFNFLVSIPGLIVIAIVLMMIFNVGIGQTICRELGLRSYSVTSKHNPKSPTKKTETVYVDTYTDGTAYSTVVDVVLKNNKETKTIVDKTSLSELNNYEGGEEYTDNGDGTVTWETPEGQDIKYEGISDVKNLPVNMKVRYYLDDKKISGEDLQGKSGKVKIVIKFKNNLTEEVNGKKTIVPVVCMTSMVVTDKSFKNINISNGKTIKTGQLSVLMGIAAPGLAKACGSEVLKDTVDNKITITGTANNFDGQEIMTMVTTDMMKVVNKKALKKINADKKIKKLDKSTKKIVKGSKQLSDGVTLLDKKYKELATGTQLATDGTKQLNVEVKSAMKQMTEATATLASATEVSTYVNTLEEAQLSEIYSSIKSASANYDLVADFMRFWDSRITSGSDDDSEDIASRQEQTEIDRNTYEEKIKAYANIVKYLADSDYIAPAEGGLTAQEAAQAKEDAINIAKHFKDKSASAYAALYSLSDNLNTAGLKTMVLLAIHRGSDSDAQDELIESFAEKQEIDISTWPKNDDGHYIGYNELLQRISDGTVQLNEGITKGSKALTSGTTSLSKGMQQINSGTKAAQKGIKKLDKGSTTLYKGMSKYYNKGIKQIVDLYNDSLKGVSGNLKNVKKAGNQYTNYSGITDDMVGSVKFMYFTPVGDY